MGDIKINEAFKIRPVIRFAYNQSSIDYSAPGSGSSDSTQTDKYIRNDSGLGLIYSQNPETRWYATLAVFGIVQNKTETKSPLTNTTTDSFDQTSALRLGLEKSLFSEKLVLRGYAGLFSFQYSKDSYSSQNPTSSNENIRKSYQGPIQTYVVGLGYQPITNLMIDLSFSSNAMSTFNNSGNSLTSSTGFIASSSNDSDSSNLNVNIVATLKF